MAREYLLHKLLTSAAEHRELPRRRRSAKKLIAVGIEKAEAARQKILDKSEEKLREAGILSAAEKVMRHEKVDLGDDTASLDIGYKKTGSEYIHIVAVRIKAKSDNLPSGKNRVLSRAVRVCLNEADGTQIVEYSKEIPTFDEIVGFRKRTVWERLDDRWLPGNSLTDKISLAIVYATGMMEDDRSWISPSNKFIGKPGIGK